VNASTFDHQTELSEYFAQIIALGYISVAESLGISSTTFTHCTPKATDFTEVTQKTAITPFTIIQGYRF